jgi:short-subunit dehydrogenase
MSTALELNRANMLRPVSLPSPSPDTAVVVTGASAGIGTELARELARRGHGLILVARRRDRLEELAAELRDANGVTVDVRPCDLADATARGALVAEVQGSGRAIVGLCNNAGFGLFGSVVELERDHEQVQLNVVALHELTHAFLPDMLARGESAILNVGSLAGNQPIPYNATYAATKAFVNSFSEGLHGELSGTGVSCTVMCPGPVRTEFADIAGVGSLNGFGGRLMWTQADRVARVSVDAMERGKRVVHPRLQEMMTAQLGRMTPRALLVPLTARVTRGRGGDSH